MRSAPPTFLFAGGGSGGHISPALAIAERIRQLEHAARSLFICSSRRIDSAMLSEAHARFQPTPASPFASRPAGLARFAMNFRRTARTASDLIRGESVDRVVALGGFVSGPVVLGALRSRVPVTLVNLDDPPGRANRWIARVSEQVLSAVEVRHRPFLVPRLGERVVGMPIRSSAIAPADPPTCRIGLGLDPHRPTLLVTGASQGAGSINGMLIELLSTSRRIFDSWQVLHLSGQSDHEILRDAYARAAVTAEVKPFHHQMGLAWGAADVAISRAGASSVAEAWANAVPTIFLPYPFHRDRHQHHNAQPMVDAGGAVIQQDERTPAANARRAGSTLAALLKDRQRLQTMRASLRALSRPDAALQIARLLLASPRKR